MRYFNVSGADENSRSGLLTNPDNLFKAICEVAVKKRDKFVVNGKNYKTKDGTTIRDFIHVSDLAEMHILAAETIINENITEIFNCGYGEGYSVKDVIDETKKILMLNLDPKEKETQYTRWQIIKNLLKSSIGNQNTIILII